MTFAKKIFLAFSILFLFLGGVVFADYFYGYRINHGGELVKIQDLSFDSGKYGFGYGVRNHIAENDFFIPTKTQNEWNSFKNHVPFGVSLCSIKNGQWSAWSNWGTCVETEYGGTQSRTRTCEAAECGGTCIGSAKQSQACNVGGGSSSGGFDPYKACYEDPVNMASCRDSILDDFRNDPEDYDGNEDWPSNCNEICNNSSGQCLVVCP